MTLPLAGPPFGTFGPLVTVFALFLLFGAAVAYMQPATMQRELVAAARAAMTVNGFFFRHGLLRYSFMTNELYATQI